MRILNLGLLLLGFACLETCAQNTTLTLEEVDSEIASFLQGLRNESGTLNSRSTLPTGCTLACSFLDFFLPGQISYSQSPTYQFEESRYWSLQQAAALPACRFSPTSAVSVSIGILTARVSSCEFAVKSGGHAAFYGASNIQGGLTVDLINLNQITVSADQAQTSVGPGNSWYNVYSKLDPKGLSVVGGRVADIGVGGLTLGGGISFFSGRYGWACDNVMTYEVVFADGTIHDVSYATYPDLYFALRGGGNNFGIVTRFDLFTFPQGDLWAGSETFVYDNSTAVALNNAFYHMDINAPSDPYAAVILAYVYVQAEDIWVIVSDLQYGLPTANPPILQNFTSIPGAISSTLRITSLTNLTVDFNNSNPGGYRETYWALMVKNSPTLMSDMTAIFMSETNAIKDVANMVPACVYQPITTDQISHFSKNGGNALGLDVSDGPLNLVNIAISWSSADDDTRVLAAARNVVEQANATAYALGLGNAFIYQNYAAADQPVFSSYGAANLEKLRAVSSKYDPSGVWQKLQPGYFKVG